AKAWTESQDKQRSGNSDFGDMGMGRGGGRNNRGRGLGRRPGGYPGGLDDDDDMDL
ncbi:MAG: hypothetical protein EZS28_042951, partial [Streblomastix strix]